MERKIKFSMVPKILSLKSRPLNLSSFFETFFESHSAEDEINYIETQALDIFTELDGSPFIHLAYDSIEGLKEIPDDKKYIFVLTEDVELPGWEKKILYELMRYSEQPQQSDQSYPFPQDDPEGWLDILKNHSPESLTNYVIKECTRGIEQGHFICRKDENGFRSLVIWNINNGIYQGRFWWNRESSLEFMKDFWSLHRFIESTGIKVFNAYCQPINKAAWKAHELLGYKPVGKKLYLYLKK